MTQLTFGVFVPQGWKMELASIADPQAKWAKAVEVAQLAEELGFDSLWVYDHFHNVPAPAHEAVFECWTTMAAISQRTTRIRLGQMVGCAPYRNPGLLAKITSNIDVISGGRLDWGIGAGWYDHEFRGYGYEFLPPKDRIARAARDRRDREGDVDRARRHLRGQPLQAAGRAVRPEAAAAAPPADLDRRRRRAAHPARRGPPRDPLELRRQAPTSGPTSATCCKALRRRRPRLRRDHQDVVARGVHPRGPRREIVDGGTRSFWGEPFEVVARRQPRRARPSRWPRRSSAYVDLGCTGFVPWCSDYPDTETLRLLGEKVIPELR